MPSDPRRPRAVRIAYRRTSDARSTGWWLTLVSAQSRSVMPDGPYPTRASARRRRAEVLTWPKE